MNLFIKKLIVVATFGTCSFFANAKMNYGDVQITHLEPIKANALWVREKQVTPMYPFEMAKKGIAGCGIYKVTVNQNGETEKVQQVTSLPARGLAKPAKKLIKKWQWKNVSGKPAANEEKLVRLDFCLGGNTVEEAQARCEQQAKFDCKA